MSARRVPYGLIAMFESADGLVAAARRVREAGYRDVDAFTPFPVDGLGEALGLRGDGVRRAGLIGAACGAVLGYALQWYSAAIDYPLNVGGRPLHSWPAFLPVAFELAVLAGASTAFFAMLAANGLPRLHHPVFGAPRFELATRDRFFLLIESGDPQFEAARTRALLESTRPVEVEEVAA